MLLIAKVEAFASAVIFAVVFVLNLLCFPFLASCVKPVLPFKRPLSTISLYIGLGGGFYGSSLGGMIGFEATAGEFGDIVLFVVVYAIAIGFLGFLLSGSYALLCVLLFSALAPATFRNCSLKAQGAAIGAFVGATLFYVIFPEMLLDSRPLLLRSILPAITGAFFGVLSKLD